MQLHPILYAMELKTKIQKKAHTYHTTTRSTSQKEKIITKFLKKQNIPIDNNFYIYCPAILLIGNNEKDIKYEMDFIKWKENFKGQKAIDYLTKKLDVFNKQELGEVLEKIHISHPIGDTYEGDIKRAKREHVIDARMLCKLIYNLKLITYWDNLEQAVNEKNNPKIRKIIQLISKNIFEKEFKKKTIHTAFFKTKNGRIAVWKYLMGQFSRYS